MTNDEAPAGTTKFPLGCDECPFLALCIEKCTKIYKDLQKKQKEHPTETGARAMSALVAFLTAPTEERQKISASLAILALAEYNLIKDDPVAGPGRFQDLLDKLEKTMEEQG